MQREEEKKKKEKKAESNSLSLVSMSLTAWQQSTDRFDKVTPCSTYLLIDQSLLPAPPPVQVVLVGSLGQRVMQGIPQGQQPVVDAPHC